MTKIDLVNRLSEAFGVSKSVSEQVIDGVVNSICDALSEHEKVYINKLGTFFVKDRAPRIGRNPRTSEEIEIPASKALRFTVSKSLKEKIQ